MNSESLVRRAKMVAAPRKQLSFSVPEALAKAFRHHCANNDVKPTDMLCLMVQDFVEDQTVPESTS